MGKSSTSKLWDLVVKSAPEMEDPVTRQHREIEEPAGCARGIEEPKLDDAVIALLVITGVRAKFCADHWVLMKDGPKGALRGGVPAEGTFEQWRVELNAIMEKAGAGRSPFG